MQVGDRILVKKGLRKEVLIVAKVNLTHSMEKIFASKSGGDFTIGIKVWKSNYVWNDRSRMWVPRN